jgi:hypothetical protein
MENGSIKFCFKLPKFYRNFQNVESSFWRADSGKNTSLEWFAEFKSSVPSVEDTEQWRQSSVSKLHENVDYVKEFYHPKQKNHYLWSH